MRLNLRLCYSLALLFLAQLAFALPGNKNIKITSFSRVFYDDNVFMRAAGTTNQLDTLYYSQSFGVDAKFFRDTITLKATPEVRHRQVDNKTLFFGSVGTKTKHSFGPKIVVDSANTFSHSEREPSSLDDNIDVTYFMNKSSAQISWQPTYLNKVRFGYENYIKRWSENLPVGSGTELTNGDFTKNSYTLTLERISGKRFILEAIGKKSLLEYNGNRGALDTDTLYGQISYVPNSYTIIKVNYGRIFAETINQAGELTEYTTPTYGANITFFTPRGTVLGFNTIYEVMDSSVAYWNMKENLKFMVIAKYKITPKLELSGMLLDMHTTYKDIGNRYNLTLEREEEVLVSSITLSWKYNEFHYAEIGYQGMHLFNDDADVFKNKYFIGYRLNF
jgi:hypothetical protein